MSAAAYPARPEAQLEQSLSGWLVLVKWCLLALPHYLIVAIFAGAARSWPTSGKAGAARWIWSSGGGGP